MNRSLIDVANSTNEWCLPSHGILTGCPTEALNKDAIALHTNLALATTTVAGALDLINIIIRKWYFKDKFNVFLTTLTLHIIGVTLFILHLGLRLWPNSLVPPWLTGLVFGLSFSFGVMSLDYVTASWLEVQRTDTFLVYVGLRKFRTLYLSNVATYAPVAVICAALMGLSPQLYAIAGRILWLLFAVMCPMRATFVLVVGLKMYRMQRKLTNTHNSATNTKRTIIGYLGICMMGFPVWGFYGICIGFVDSTAILWHIIWAFTHIVFLVFSTLFFWWTISAAVFRSKSPPASTKGNSRSHSSTAVHPAETNHASLGE